jgi:hypothetical protein
MCAGAENIPARTLHCFHSIPAQQGDKNDPITYIYFIPQFHSKTLTTLAHSITVQGHGVSNTASHY